MLEEFSARLREARIKTKLTQTQVSKLVGLNKAAISMYESGIRRPSYETLIRLATLYHVSIDYLFGLVSESPVWEQESYNESERALVEAYISFVRQSVRCSPGGNEA